MTSSTGTGPSFPLLLCAHAFHGIWIPFIQVCRTTLVREKAPAEMHGRVFSPSNLPFVGCTPLSLLATGLLGNAFLASESLGASGGPPLIYLIAGVGGGVCGLTGIAFGQFRRSRQALLPWGFIVGRFDLSRGRKPSPLPISQFGHQPKRAFQVIEPRLRGFCPAAGRNRPVPLPLTLIHISQGFTLPISRQRPLPFT
ncbi:MAG: hypothetical protein JRJ19_15140 [Deltaproteobacteria bacterium]|nr:hypothetical protein [Deltaproteobacteria bacterium]